ncbi:NfeD family protein [Rubrivivax gelatinosus]|uniref:Nodulation protein NfeD n=1 Tax=Rubrivivax gelatinosus TaxID=28068 RepID=A0ABS1DZJ7_RUBGE|nr:nodulation protein NfeD [Rubrivivax gelatinosus]MBK1714586.1 nodulation protein NfeD [Rubrivivax gelatinosus]
MRHALPPAFTAAVFALLLVFTALAGVAQPARTAVVLTLDGAVGPASADHLRRGLAAAQRDGATLVVLQIDTPGGLDSSMREIVRAITASPLPVLAWVGPAGARAASAGTFIVYASHLAAMAPGTNLGAATPVALAGPGPDVRRAASAPEPSAAKATNDAVAYLRSLAELRGRNADWAERAVRDAASLPAAAALKAGVVEIVADSVPALLAQADGRTVRLAAGELRLQSAGLAVERRDADWRTRALNVITNPNLALILMAIGVYGLLFEFMSPGAVLPGVVGAICLLLGLYALSTLPISSAGAALLVLGLTLMVAEAFAPSFGVLGLGGAVAFVFGATLLIDTDAPQWDVSLPLVAGLALASAAAAVVVVRAALKVRRLRPHSGAQAMLDATARVLDWAGADGHVLVHGERWHAVADATLTPGDTVRVRAVDGLTLRVARNAAPSS